MRHRHRRKGQLRCPQCLSNQIALVIAGITGQRYRCPACGYQGSLVLETETPLSERPS